MRYSDRNVLMIHPTTDALRCAQTLSPPGPLSEALMSLYSDILCEQGLCTLYWICSHKHHYASFTGASRLQRCPSLPGGVPGYAWEGPLSVREVSHLDNKPYCHPILKAPGRSEALPNSSNRLDGLCSSDGHDRDSPGSSVSSLVDLHASVPKSLGLSNTFAYANISVNLARLCASQQTRQVYRCYKLQRATPRPSVVQFCLGLLFRLEDS